nr:immunoglobulin heavy chain junction region [Macaca mulatta]
CSTVANSGLDSW